VHQNHSGSNPNAINQSINQSNTPNHLITKFPVFQESRMLLVHKSPPLIPF